ncbi:MAG: hypothetical protein ACLT5C_06670 [Blautia hansenii]
MSKMKKKNRHIGRKILFGVEILVLVLLVGALFVYAQINKKMDKLNLNDEDGEDIQVQMNENIAGNEVLKIIPILHFSVLTKGYRRRIRKQ